MTVRLVFALLFWCVAAPAETAKEKADLRTGMYLYREQCIVCHDIDKPQADTRKMAPSMHRFFQNELTPMTKVPVSEAYFRVKVQFGGDLMPAYVNKLTERQLDLLTDYVRSRNQ